MNRFEELSDEENWIGKEIVDCAFKVHSNLGPGLLEKIYESCFCHELKKKKLKFLTQVKIPINYEGIIFNEGFRVDVFIEDKVICEIKSVVDHNPVFEAQVLTYLKLTKNRLGYLINFNVPIVKSGIKRIIL
ncbi:MAG TPA: GxxExxY protein [Ignavibacteria bacterium]|nr:GxxExxY protein [Ignavibacteria bacterium]